MEQKIQLKESDIPRQRYNLAGDLPIPRLHLLEKLFTS